MHRLLAVFMLVCSSVVAHTSVGAQTPEKDHWANWAPFLGTWQGIGGGEPGQGVGEFSFAPELQGVVLTRRNYAEYPASKDKSAYRHDDLMVIYKDSEGKKTRADYWDNEGHVIHYSVDVSADKLIFTSDPEDPGPRFRLTYVKTDADTLELTFEFAPPGDRNAFKPYIQASARRKAHS